MVVEGNSKGWTPERDMERHGQRQRERETVEGREGEKKREREKHIGWDGKSKQDNEKDNIGYSIVQPLLE